MSEKISSYSDYKRSLDKKRPEPSKSSGQKSAKALKRKNGTGKARTKRKEQQPAARDSYKEKRPQISKEEKIKRKKERTAALVSGFLLLCKKVGLVLFVLIALGELMLLINFEARIHSIQFEINDITANLDEKKELLKELNSQKEAAYKSETIENIARYNLGMIYPTKEQTVYINLD